VALIATLSFDDGGEHDLEVLALLRRRALTATFYVPVAELLEANYRGMNNEAICRAYDGFEVGVHGYMHRRMSLCSGAELYHETTESLKEMGRFFKRAFYCFAHPYDDSTVLGTQALREAGYLYARRFFVNPELVARPNDPLNIPISLRFGERQDVEHLIGRPVHIGGHPWEIAKQGTLPALEDAIDTLLGAGYEFVDNKEFFGRTVCPR
jgi:peptidoglycan/xylan/chitin deacetylase (PgdA/CDA1 family)